MATYAEIIDGQVAQVLVVGGTEEEAIGWLRANVSENEWVKTAIDGSIRGKYAGKGDEYHPDLDAFVRKVPFKSWKLDRETKMYLPPIPRPLAVAVGHIWVWSEKALKWIRNER